MTWIAKITKPTKTPKPTKPTINLFFVMNTIPGIVSIRYTECSNLHPHVMHHSICGEVIAVAAPCHSISFFGVPKCKWSGSLSSGCRMEKSTLEFETSDIIPEGRRLAFIVSVAGGKQFLIGSREPNYPQIEYSETTGSPSGDAAVRSYKISHTGLKSMLPCVL